MQGLPPSLEDHAAHDAVTKERPWPAGVVQSMQREAAAELSPRVWPGVARVGMAACPEDYEAEFKVARQSQRVEAG